MCRNGWLVEMDLGQYERVVRDTMNNMQVLARSFKRFYGIFQNFSIHATEPKEAAIEMAGKNSDKCMKLQRI